MVKPNRRAPQPFGSCSIVAGFSCGGTAVQLVQPGRIAVVQLVQHGREDRGGERNRRLLVLRRRTRSPVLCRRLLVRRKRERAIRRSGRGEKSSASRLGPSLLRHRRLGSLAPPSGLEAARPKGQGLTPTARLRLSPPGFVGAGGPSSSEREREREREEEEERGERGGNTGGRGREKGEIFIFIFNFKIFFQFF